MFNNAMLTPMTAPKIASVQKKAKYIVCLSFLLGRFDGAAARGIAPSSAELIVDQDLLDVISCAVAAIAVGGASSALFLFDRALFHRLAPLSSGGSTGFLDQGMIAAAAAEAANAVIDLPLSNAPFSDSSTVSSSCASSPSGILVAAGVEGGFL